MFRYLSLFCITITLCYSSDVHNSTQFSLDLYQNLFNQNENTIVSPYSLRVLLSILYQAAHGSSETQLSEKVHLGEKHDTLELQKSSIAHTLSSPSVKLANIVYLRNGLTLKRNFNEIVNEFKSSMEQVDFNDKIEAAQKMNSWVEEKTNGLIKNLVTPGAISPDTTLFLINTVYFKATWKKPFNKSYVRKNTFVDINNEEHEIDMMRKTSNYRFGTLNELKSKVVELEYAKGSNFVFWVILPNVESSLMEVKSLLTPEMITNIDDTIYNRQIILTLPLFEIEQSLDCKQILNNMGLDAIFKGEIELLEGRQSLKVDQIKQKSKIIVNTDGTEAATGTYASAVKMSMKKVFSASRPFIYMILTADTKEPIFVGHYSKVET